MQHGSISKRDLFVIYLMNGSVENQVDGSLWILKQQRFCQERCGVPDAAAAAARLTTKSDQCVRERTMIEK
jgi:hypothetical protein